MIQTHQYHFVGDNSFRWRCPLCWDIRYLLLTLAEMLIRWSVRVEERVKD
jgi:hypothetical protein